MSEWRTDEPPKDRTFLADFGYPWPVVAVWNVCEETFVYANLQCGMVDGIEGDTYFENEYEREAEIKRWMPMPEID